MFLRAVGDAAARMAVDHPVTLGNPANPTGSREQKNFLKE